MWPSMMHIATRLCHSNLVNASWFENFRGGSTTWDFFILIPSSFGLLCRARGTAHLMVGDQFLFDASVRDNMSMDSQSLPTRTSDPTPPTARYYLKLKSRSLASQKKRGHNLALLDVFSGEELEPFILSYCVRYLIIRFIEAIVI